MRETSCYRAVRIRRPAEREIVRVDPVVAGTALIGLVLAALIVLPGAPDRSESGGGSRIDATDPPHEARPSFP